MEKLIPSAKGDVKNMSHVAEKACIINIDVKRESEREIFFWLQEYSAAVQSHDGQKVPKKRLCGFHNMSSVWSSSW